MSRSPTRTTRVVGRVAELLAVASGATAHDVPARRRPGGGAGSTAGGGGAHGGRDDVLRVCAGAGRGVCARGGTTYGEVFVTRRPIERVGASTVAHELVHVRQWRRYGVLMPVLYALAELTGGGPLRNRFEQQAGLRDGGYLP